MDDLPKTRAEAKALGVPRYFTGVPCGRGHIAPRRTAGAGCESCRQILAKERYEKEGEVIRQRARKYYYDNQEYVKKNVSAWQKENAERVNELARVRNAKDRSAQRRRYEAYVARNPDKHLAKGAARIAARRLRSTGTRLGKMYAKEIETFYETARLRSVETGVPHEVDHVIPLCGKTVSGLHVPWNLRVIPKVENRKKWNKFDIEEAA